MTHPISQSELDDIKKKYESITTSCVSCNDDVSRLLDEVERLRDNLHQFKFSYEEAWIKQEGELASLRSMLGRAEVTLEKMAYGDLVQGEIGYSRGDLRSLAEQVLSEIRGENK